MVCTQQGHSRHARVHTYRQLEDDQEDLLEWDKVPLLIEGIGYYFGDWVFTPADRAALFPDEWPTPRQLLDMGKRSMSTF